jgi:hypothetical protein
MSLGETWLRGNVVRGIDIVPQVLGGIITHVKAFILPTREAVRAKMALAELYEVLSRSAKNKSQPNQASIENRL